MRSTDPPVTRALGLLPDIHGLATRMSLRAVTPRLKHKILDNVDGYLSGRLSGKKVSKWALDLLRGRNFAEEEALLEDTLVALATLHDEDSQFDTAREDLESLKEYLLGRREYRRDSTVVRHRLSEGGGSHRLKGA